MALLQCPECAHEVSFDAAACPNCGHPLGVPPQVVVERKVVVPPPPRESSFPPWAMVPIVLLALVLVVVGFLVFRQNGDQANTNVNVALAGRRPVSESNREIRTSAPSSEPQPVSLPPTQTTTVPGTATSVPNVPPPDKGTVKLSAKIAPTTGQPQAARGTRFYLLDRDVESILSDARVEPIEGNTLAASLGLAAVFPARYGEFQHAAMNAISKHVKYSGTTGATGTADIKGVDPNSYYLFAISRATGGFALWNQNVAVVVGDNVMNLTPQPITEVPDTNG